MDFKGRIASAAVCAATLVISLFAQGSETYKTRLSAVPADGKTRADLTGVGTATATLAGSKLTINGTFDGLKSAATVAKLHNAIAAGVRGPEFQDLTVSKAVNGTISGSVDLTPPQLQNLRKGGIYIQIHSERAPEGVLWGWLVR